MKGHVASLFLTFPFSPYTSISRDCRLQNFHTFGTTHRTSPDMAMVDAVVKHSHTHDGMFHSDKDANTNQW